MFVFYFLFNPFQEQISLVFLQLFIPSDFSTGIRFFLFFFSSLWFFQIIFSNSRLFKVEFAYFFLYIYIGLGFCSCKFNWYFFYLCCGVKWLISIYDFFFNSNKTSKSEFFPFCFFFCSQWIFYLGWTIFSFSCCYYLCCFGLHSALSWCKVNKL